jgi:hypothetical protein
MNKPFSAPQANHLRPIQPMLGQDADLKLEAGPA